MRQETQEDHGTRSREQLENIIPGSSSWKSYGPQGVKEFDEDDDEPHGSDFSYYDSNAMTSDFLMTGSSR